MEQDSFLNDSKLIEQPPTRRHSNIENSSIPLSSLSSRPKSVDKFKTTTGLVVLEIQQIYDQEMAEMWGNPFIRSPPFDPEYVTDQVSAFARHPNGTLYHFHHTLPKITINTKNEPLCLRGRFIESSNSALGPSFRIRLPHLGPITFS